MTTTADGVDELLDAARAGERGALARLLTLVERGGEAARAVGRAAHGRAAHGRGEGATASGWTVGITGAPGAGKSTLTNALVAAMRADDVQVAVLAVDPSSPFTGGAILGDRVRMSDHALDPGVFIRSMATRGHLGGLALAAPEAVRLLHAVGIEWVLVETVGVGQVEVEVAGNADTTVVVVNPGWGDAVQANKAGLMEIADVFVVNKADRPGADDTRRDLDAMLDLADRPGGWRPPVVATAATTGDGVAELWGTLREHRRDATASGAAVARRDDRLAAELARIVTERLRARAAALAHGERFTRVLGDVTAGRLDPWAAADELLAE
ncbi:MAG TPA: methylmalonyl Co-A mutase-associated GTPase MeaB [Acidimicrobiales bacterium]|nr:methylmalonyl Co-A mutase-associated GTPase MeaB [Acidimicrobiales bacterium]